MQHVNPTEVGDWSFVHCFMFMWNVAVNLPFGFIAVIDELKEPKANRHVEKKIQTSSKTVPVHVI